MKFSMDVTQWRNKGGESGTFVWGAVIKFNKFSKKC